MTPKDSVKLIEKTYVSYKYQNRIRYDSILEWTLKNPYNMYDKKKANTIEKMWGNRMIYSKKNNQWTTKLGEYIVRQTFINKGVNVWNPCTKEHFLPDLETDNYIYEVKTRNWTTTGTAGEKVLGTPYKYSDIPRLYNKPLRIVCVAYQEYELTNGNYNVFGSNISKEKKDNIKYWRDRDIYFMPFSKLLTTRSKYL